MSRLTPALRYFGGKWRIAKWVIKHLPEHRCYVEPFGGGASILLRKKPSKIEVYNDLGGSVVNFFRVLRDQHDQLIRYLKLTPFALEEYHFCRQLGDDPVERARRFFVRSWGGHTGTTAGLRNRGWGRTPDRSRARQMVAAIDNLAVLAERLRTVAIDSVDWREVLAKYVRPDTLFYVDPPYVRSARSGKSPSDGYGEHDMSFEEHAELVKKLKETVALVVLSGYANELYDSELKNWKRIQKTAQPRSEVLWISK